MKMHRYSKTTTQHLSSADYEAQPFTRSHTIFECVRIRSRDGTVASAMSRKPNGKSDVATAKFPSASTNGQGDEYRRDYREGAAVYLLDDDSSILKATRRLLDSAGWNNVETFTDPSAFLERAAMHRPDLAVIDMRMPVMNGLEVQTRLRTVSPSTRVIVLTGSDDPSIRRTAMNAGASGFFIKGMESDDFLACVKSAGDCGN